MVIGIISSEYPPETGFGGIGTYSKHIAEYLAKNNHRVTVFCRSTTGKGSVSVINAVTVYRIPPRPYPLPRFRIAYPFRQWCTRLFPHTLHRLSWALAVAGTIKKVCRTYPRFDVIEAPECGAEGLFISRHMARKRVIRMHTPWEMIRELDCLKEPFGDDKALPLLEKFTAAKANGLTAPSRAIASEIQHRWHMHSIDVIPNPLPVANYHRSSGTEWIYSGRIERRKGVHHLIAAYASCLDRGYKLPGLVLLGKAYGSNPDGSSYRSDIRNMLDNINNGDTIHWIEDASLDTVTKYLQNSAVAFFPSLWENFPYACLEAMASGCAVVATRCGGFPEIITHNENGLLVEPDSSRSIASAMKYLMNHPECRERLGLAARQFTRKTVAPEIAGCAMETYYRNLLER